MAATQELVERELRKRRYTIKPNGNHRQVLKPDGSLLRTPSGQPVTLANTLGDSYRGLTITIQQLVRAGAFERDPRRDGQIKAEPPNGSFESAAKRRSAETWARVREALIELGIAEKEKGVRADFARFAMDTAKRKGIKSYSNAQSVEVSLANIVNTDEPMLGMSGWVCEFWNTAVGELEAQPLETAAEEPIAAEAAPKEDDDVTDAAPVEARTPLDDVLAPRGVGEAEQPDDAAPAAEAGGDAALQARLAARVEITEDVERVRALVRDAVELLADIDRVESLAAKQAIQAALVARFPRGLA